MFVCLGIMCFTSFFFFFNDTATTEIYTLSLHDALPILAGAAQLVTSESGPPCAKVSWPRSGDAARWSASQGSPRSEEHTSELQSPCNLVCRLLLEKKKKTHKSRYNRERK